jgi:prevent-host-death family protein
MERRIAVRTLNQQTSAVLNAVANGQEVTVTSAGRPVARIVPVAPASELDRLVSAGEAIAPTVRGPIALPPVTAGSDIDVAAAIARDREQEQW